MSVSVRKTYKLFVGGKFPRSESGRVYQPASNELVNVARASRKDLRDAVAAARKGLAAWSGSTAYLRGQIL
ncbi:MAG: aldehyde dehydrogenase, partial [Planctomycetota bacterium]|nr:aldehyde dehydrogenase [Planctomycetota bacterium]